MHRHYRGFARNQLRALEQDPTAKKLLYVLRTALTGIHVLETGEVETDVTCIMHHYGLAEAQELVARKRVGERVALESAVLESWRARVDGLFDRLDRARETSRLPETAPNVAELEAWLLGVRRARF